MYDDNALLQAYRSGRTRLEGHAEIRLADLIEVAGDQIVKAQMCEKVTGYYDMGNDLKYRPVSVIEGDDPSVVFHVDVCIKEIGESLEEIWKGRAGAR